MKDKPGIFALNPAVLHSLNLVCPKCGAVQGNGWEQCEGSCPMFMSPHFSQEENDKYLESQFSKGAKE